MPASASLATDASAGGPELVTNGGANPVEPTISAVENGKLDAAKFSTED